jgi:signal transduction histidine kinase
MQIRTRLTIQFIITVAAILLLTLAGIYTRYKQSLEDEFYRGLRFKATMTAEMVLRQEANLATANPVTPGAPSLIPATEAIAIYNTQQKKVFALNLPSGDLNAQTLNGILAQGECRITYGEMPALGVRHVSSSGTEYVVVAASIFQSEELKKLFRILLISFLIGISLVALAGWFFAGRALAPVSQIVNQVETILPSNMSARLNETPNRDEIGRLVHTFNRLLDRIYFAFQMQKRFISNVSHELKNPISVIIAQLEVGLNKPKTNEEYREILQSVLEDSKSMADITEKLLQMARVYSEDSNISFTTLRLDEILLQVRAALLRAKPTYHILFDLTGDIDSEVQLDIKGNEALLRLALTNLIDNGCKFSPDHTVKTTISAYSNGTLELIIQDNGPGIPKEDLPLIFQPFYRGVQQTKVAGSGIGLSLVESILRLHQAKIEVASEIGKGTQMRLLFGVDAQK